MSLFSRIWALLTLPFRFLVGLPGRVPQRLLRLSVPARVALLLFVFLVVLAVAVPLASYLLTKNPAARVFWLKYVYLIVLLVFAIPLVAYQALKLWLEGETSRYPDIDYAWKAGLAELGKNGMDLTQIPIFLVLGVADEALEKALFDSARLSLRVREIPGGPAALHWYASPDGVFLTCPGASALSKLASLGKAAATKPIPAGAAGSWAAPDLLRGTVVGDLGASEPSIATSGPLPARTAAASHGPGPDIRGTMMVSGPMEVSGGLPRIDPTPLALSPIDANEQEQRLEYVCRLIRRVRQPLCGINGILTLLPFSLIQRSPKEGIEVQRAAKRDLTTVLRALKLRCPVTAVVSGLETENGFRELVRRVGRDRAAAQRFGKGFGLWNPPLGERVEALSAHACGAFEDWVYSLFREKGSLSKPGNTKLYALLCKVRRNVQGRLANVLAGAFGSESEQDARETLLFGGCYFAGTGETEDRQAFGKGVVDKLPEQQEELEWTSAALAEDRKYRRWAGTAMAVNALLFAGMVGMLVYRFWP